VNAPRVLIGMDLIEIDRVAAALARHPERFRQRVYTEREIAECDRKKVPAESYAGRFAAKGSPVAASRRSPSAGAWRGPRSASASPPSISP
jgi:holo-[acyl-carrier protein] synthase